MTANSIINMLYVGLLVVFKQVFVVVLSVNIVVVVVVVVELPQAPEDDPQKR